MKRIIIGGCATVAVALGAGYAVAGTSDTPRPAAAGEPTVTTLSGYELGDSPADAVSFSGNELIFEGTVAGPPGKGRRVQRAFPDGTKIDYVYTPVPVRVTRVRKGTGMRPGQIIQMRALGGTTGSHTTVSELGPAASSFRSGQQLVLFTQAALDAGDGLRAVTPNFTFVHNSQTNTVQSLTHGGPGKPIRAELFQRMLAKDK